MLATSPRKWGEVKNGDPEPWIASPWPTLPTKGSLKGEG